MSDGRRERSDAVRNRRAILAATERLLATHRPQDISMEQVAAAAGVGKGTVFHRFGNRAGLMFALMVERARGLEDAVTSGPPPLGAGAPDRERLLAFMDAVVDVVARNKSLLSELGHIATQPAHQQHSRPSAAASPESDESGSKSADSETDDDQAPALDEHPVYRFWHGHISSLIAVQRSDLDGATIAHILLGSLHSDAILNQLSAEGPDGLTAAMRTMICAILDAPREATAAP